MNRRQFLAASALGAAAVALPVALRRRGSVSNGRSAARQDLRFTSHAGQRIVEAGRVCDVATLENRVMVASGAGASLTLADVATPVSVSCRGENVYIVEWSGNRVGAFDPSGRRVASVGGDELARPRDAAWLDDELVVADTFHQRVAVFDRGGRLSRSIGRFGTGSGELSAASSVAVDREGRLWVADSGNARLQVFSASGRPLGAVGGHGGDEGLMLSPRCVRIDGRGDVHVADTTAGLVHVFDGEGRFRQRHRPDGGLPIWLSVLPDGGVLVSVKPARAA